MTRWTIAQFRPKWSFSGIGFKLMSVHVFVCKWMCVLLVQFFTREGLTGGEQSEREREPCHTSFHPATMAWWNMTSADQDNVISSTFLSWSAFISRPSFISHMMSLLNLCTHLASSPTSTLIYFSNHYYKPQKTKKKPIMLG
jgi:hypothetical protein